MNDLGPQFNLDMRLLGNFVAYSQGFGAKNSRMKKYGSEPNENSPNKYGNILVDGEKPEHNFVSSQAFVYAKHNILEKQVNQFLTIDRWVERF